MEREIYLLKDSKKRTFVKAIIWRFIATGCTFILLVIFGEVLSKALVMTGCDFFFKTITFYIYERLFIKVKWGRQIKKIYDLTKYTNETVPIENDNEVNDRKI